LSCSPNLIDWSWTVPFQIGLFLIKVLKARGAGTIYVSEPATSRRELTLKFGADSVIDPKKDVAELEVMQKTNGVGVDVSFDCAGVSESLNSCVKATRYTGTICIISLFEAPAKVDVNALLIGEKRIVGKQRVPMA
jgi:(R,R)-butanediol dehydrogenase/meso-butanediol dehydrogenase/diacetyl reductase